MLWTPLNKIVQFQSLLVRHSQNRSISVSKSKCQWKNSVFGAHKSDPMSSYKLRFILREFTVTRLWNAYFRTQLLNSVVRRCRRDHLRLWVCLRQTLLRPHRTLAFTVAAYNQDDDDEDGEPCSQDITDEDLEALVHDFESVDELSRTTLFCPGCQRRLVIDKKQPGVVYCTCSNAVPPPPSEDGWVPYMEADDVIIWRKEYKPGGLFAYKVYGRYKDLTARDFAMIQVDGAYRRSWDDAVAALSVVEPGANGVRSQTVIHWEVLWPRLFANRDYVYLRRHKEFNVKSKCLAHKDAIFATPELQPCAPPPERPSVHSRAKLKAQQMERSERKLGSESRGEIVNKVYVILSRSCSHPDAPETKHAIRVQEYWSHMVVRTIDGPDTVGMEFVLTYYDEPSVGGLPSGVSAWATGRAAPSYLARMHRAALHYRKWRAMHTDPPDFEPFDAEQPTPRPVGHKPRAPHIPRIVNELELEASIYAYCNITGQEKKALVA
ncbi:stAR-related lipid transfer protein 7, mitochondrial [Cydia fagiglandana]|uniref:stAR-related lipid transfer protein 7, mitochondrial n=1 Tax=Cydia fagiglandana TaxID=1458189 RepID=UPI002FEE0C0D